MALFRHVRQEHKYVQQKSKPRRISSSFSPLSKRIFFFSDWCISFLAFLLSTLDSVTLWLIGVHPVRIVHGDHVVHACQSISLLCCSRGAHPISAQNCSHTMSTFGPKRREREVPGKFAPIPSLPSTVDMQTESLYFKELFVRVVVH